ncbi:unnamed protein product [Rotaria sordida]|uniref:ABC transporter domain-containing protein n=1 Tax=Rotaria sordida TaxID=392033 RepID=A0A814H2W7_9BILA|nr:unnamed protein product [Rotaria sordida]CAF3761350.1 unnamed protein product [Rotaria sordida]
MECTISDHHQLSNPCAIELIDVTIRLSNKDILKSINLSIEQGGIFALLGPSGCGKTTLIRTLVGRLHPIANHDKTQGKISILGKHPHAFGQLVGFMPQEMALHSTNTIDEELFFYGRLADMSTQKIQQRCQFLINLLELPHKRKSIFKLSGGQQRRVSFAIALLHEPRLLILDEPTVGVDPLLRKKIWQHLTEITMKTDVTAILTTHYIEEARQANLVSFMRHGQLLETGHPNELLLKHEQQTLEGVFLELCERRRMLEMQRHGQENIHHHKSLTTIANKIRHSCQSIISSCCMKNSCCRALRSCARPSIGRSLYALLIKDIIKFQRNPFMLIIQFLVPILQITLFCLCVGRKLTNVPIGFISRETIQSSSMSGLIFNNIDKNVLNLIEYKSIDEPQHLFQLGYLLGIIDIGGNFTRELFEKINSCSYSDVNKYNDSQLIIYLDQTNRQMVYSIAEEFIRVFKSIDVEFHLGFFTSISSNQSLFKLGHFQNYLPDIEHTFTHFMIPGIVLSVIFFFNVALTALSLVTEQSDGTQERVSITGVKSNEIILSQLIIHLLILIIQIVIVLFTSLYIFKIPLRGSLLYSSLLCMIQGFCGMTFGLVISTIFTTEINAHQVTMSTFYPVLLLSGIVWPIEGQPMWMRRIAKWLPMTKAIDAMRGILLKGWSIKHLIVQQGFIVTFIWSMVFLILTLLIFNCRRL